MFIYLDYQRSRLIVRNHRPNIFQLDCNGKKCTKPDGTTETYYVGIIDILVQYENFKRAENMLKKVVYYKVRLSDFLFDTLLILRKRLL